MLVCWCFRLLELLVCSTSLIRFCEVSPVQTLSRIIHGPKHDSYPLWVENCWHAHDASVEAKHWLWTNTREVVTNKDSQPWFGLKLALLLFADLIYVSSSFSVSKFQVCAANWPIRWRLGGGTMVWNWISRVQGEECGSEREKKTVEPWPKNPR